MALAGHAGAQKRVEKGVNNISQSRQGTVGDEQESRAKQLSLKAPALTRKWIWDWNIGIIVNLSLIRRVRAPGEQSALGWVQGDGFPLGEKCWCGDAWDKMGPVHGCSILWDGYSILWDGYQCPSGWIQHPSGWISVSFGMDTASLGMEASWRGGTMGPNSLQSSIIVLQSWHLAAVKKNKLYISTSINLLLMVRATFTVKIFSTKPEKPSCCSTRQGKTLLPTPNPTHAMCFQPRVAEKDRQTHGWRDSHL